VIVDCAVYRNGRRVPGVLDLEDALEAGRAEPESFVWIGLHEPSVAEFDAVVKEFQLPALAVEDALHAHQRPKFETYGELSFLVLKPAGFSDGDMVELGQVVIFISSDFIVSVRHGETSALHAVRLRLEERPELLRCGPSAVVYAILDHVVDDYGAVLRALIEQVDLVEQAVFSGIRANQGSTIYRLKREVIEFQRAAGPLLEAVEELIANKATPIHADASNHFRDVQDHLERVNDHLHSLDVLLGSALSANLAEVGIRQNEDMRKISAWVAIVAVPTMIAGVYGMNFDHMPEIGWKYGYPFALVLMAVPCSILYRAFKRNGWL
jgi:magnesium transporter